jgi:hypothetical protein
MTTTPVRISISGCDTEETDRLARQFRRELLGLDANTVTFAQPDTAPPGTKGNLVTTGTLTATLANSAVLASICQLARTWVTRDRSRHIIIKDGDRRLELHGGNTEQHQQIIDAFLSAAKAPD